MNCTDLIFDLYGTLVDIHTEESAQVWEKTAVYLGFYGVHITGPALKAAFTGELSRREIQAGQSYECYPDIPFEAVLCSILERADFDGDAGDLAIRAAQLFRVCSMEYIRLYSGVLSALEHLRQKGLRLWLLSNAQRVFTAYELRHLGLDTYFGGIYISSDYGCRKPDSRFYKALLQEQNLDPTRCLMIGNDRDTDIAGAKALGIPTLYMHTALTPQSQAPADPALHPERAPSHCQDFEYEGWDWAELTELIEHIQKKSR